MEASRAYDKMMLWCVLLVANRTERHAAPSSLQYHSLGLFKCLKV